MGEQATTRFGLQTAKTPATYATGTGSSQSLAAANPARKTLIITNLSLSAVLWIAFGATAVAGKGVPLAPGSSATSPGRTLVISGQDYVGEVSGIISDTTANNIAVSEI